ncbi:MAG: site-2 protease family protein [Actinomycetota bacterium]|jgi:Zn-dependent protease|nr:site-2 protease family protein [Actinomycetota bacterium]
MLATFSALSLRFAGYLLVSLVIGMIAREYARAFVTAKLGDPTPRLWGRLTLNPTQWFDPFGSGILPGLILILWASASGFLPPPFAYGKPAALDPNYLRRRERDVVVASLAGPVANLILGTLGGFVLQLGITGDALLAAGAFVFTNISLFVFHLMPIPGLDGARILARFLPLRARTVYTNLDQYLVLFVLVIFFLLPGPLLSIVDGLTNAVCGVVAGGPCR